MNMKQKNLKIFRRNGYKRRLRQLNTRSVIFAQKRQMRKERN